jgi:hypothetical protein
MDYTQIVKEEESKSSLEGIKQNFLEHIKRKFAFGYLWQEKKEKELFRYA